MYDLNALVGLITFMYYLFDECLPITVWQQVLVNNEMITYLSK